MPHVASSCGSALPQLLATWAIGAVRVTHKRWLADPRLDPVRELDRAFAALADLRGVTR